MAFLIRDTLADNGSGPTDGTVYMSPDIIPNFANTLTAGTLATNYGSYVGPAGFGNPINNGQINNIYVRVKNLSSSASSGTVALYYFTSAFFAQPSTWLSIQVATAPGQTQLIQVSDATNVRNGTTVGAGDVGWTSSPFVLTSLDAPAAGTHYCFVAISATGSATPAPPPSFTSNAAFTSWVEDNANVAWRNFTFIPATTTAELKAITYGNANGQSESFFFQATAQNCPTGTTLLFQDLNCNPSINLNANLPTPNSDGLQITATSEVTLPANYSGVLLVQANAPNGQSFPSNWSIQPQAFQISQPDASEHERAVARPHPWHKPQADGSVAVTTVQVLPMGGVTMAGGTGSES